MSKILCTTKETTHINISDYSDPSQVVGKTIDVETARAAPDLKRSLQKLLWKAKDQLFVLKDSKIDYQESSEYIEQLKQYIAEAERLLK